MKINIEVSDDIIEEIVTNFCEKMGIERVTNDQRKIIINKICEAIEAELTDNAVDDAAQYVNIDEIKYKLGRKTFEGMRK